MEDKIDSDEKKYPSLGILNFTKNLSLSLSQSLKIDINAQIENFLQERKSIDVNERIIGKKIDEEVILESKKSMTVLKREGSVIVDVKKKIEILKILKCRFQKFCDAMRIRMSGGSYFSIFVNSLSLFIGIYNFSTILFRCSYLLRSVDFHKFLYLTFLFLFFDVVFDVISLMEFLISFWKPYHSKRDGTIRISFGKTATHYLRDWFIVDTISILPIDYLVLMIGILVSIIVLDSNLALTFVQFLCVLRINRVVKLIFHYFSYFSYFESHLVLIPQYVVRISKYFLILILSSHLFGCLFHVVSCSENIQKNIMWTGLDDYGERSIYEKYIFQFHWAYVLVTGYGGTLPSSLKQAIFSVFIVAIGIVINISFVGIVSTIISDVYSVDASKRQNFEKVKLYMQYKGINRKLRKAIISYYGFMFDNRRQWDEKTVLNSLPAYLRTEIAISMNLKIVKRVNLFENASKAFISSVVTQLNPRFVLPRQLIIKQGEIGREMYFLPHGKVEVLVNGKKVAELEEGSFFGEIALLENTVRNASIRALSFCDIYVLTKESFLKLESDYPREVGWIRSEAKKRDNMTEKDEEEGSSLKEENEKHVVGESSSKTSVQKEKVDGVGKVLNVEDKSPKSPENQLEEEIVIVESNNRGIGRSVISQEGETSYSQTFARKFKKEDFKCVEKEESKKFSDKEEEMAIAKKSEGAEGTVEEKKVVIDDTIQTVILKSSSQSDLGGYTIVIERVSSNSDLEFVEDVEVEESEVIEVKEKKENEEDWKEENGQIIPKTSLLEITEKISSFGAMRRSKSDSSMKDGRSFVSTRTENGDYQIIVKKKTKRRRSVNVKLKKKKHNTPKKLPPVSKRRGSTHSSLSLPLNFPRIGTRVKLPPIPPKSSLEENKEENSKNM